MSDWNAWVEALDPQQRQALLNAVGPMLQESASTGVVDSLDDVTILRPDAADKLVLGDLNYVDVYGLTQLYNGLAFKKNLLVKGPKGIGKTLSILYYAMQTTTPIVIVECSEGTKPRDFIGTFFLKGGKDTPFILGDIPTAIDIANEVGRCMLHFEEINGLTPTTQKRLNGILDFRQAVSIPQIGKNYSLNPGAMLWCTAAMNPEVYGGTYELNTDLRSRFDEVEIKYPNMMEERKIVKANIPTMSNAAGSILDSVLTLANETRQKGLGYALSTRDVVRIIEDVDLIGVDNALQLAACKFENDDRDTVTKRVKSLFSGVSVQSSWTQFK